MEPRPPKAERVLTLPPARIRAAHLFALSGFAIAQPAFNRLTNHPDYLAIGGFRAIDVVIAGIAWLIVPPAVLMAIELVARFLHSKAAAVVHGLFVALLVSILLVRALLALSPTVAVGTTLGGALMFLLLYRTWEPIRMLLTVSALAPVAFLALFLIRAPLGELSTTEVRARTMPQVAARTPVVVLIFDEFPVSSLMTETDRIDAVRYPNFAALAGSSTWYRSATTVYDFSEWAVPAILTGKRPRHDQMPLLADHPENLFTLLGRRHRIDAFEAETRLCPESLCRSVQEPFGERLRKLAIRFEGFMLPTRLLVHLPAWRNPSAEVTRFLESVRPGPGDHPPLYVLHVLLPHQPWRHLPSGRVYQSWSSDVLEQLPDDKRLVDELYQQHLLQVGYADRVLGRAINRLRSAGLWDRSLVVVTADHGVSFRPGGHERLVNSKNISDIAPVPLFVKEPQQRRGMVDDLSARSIDIVPTIVDVLGIRTSWRLDGRSLMARDRPLPSKIVVGSETGDVLKFSWSEVKAGRDATVARKTRLFGSGAESMYASGRDRELLGADVNSRAAWQSPTTYADLQQPSSTFFDPRSSHAPSRVTGTVTSARAGQMLKLAVAVNGRIAAITETFRSDGKTRFSTFVPDTAFRAGQNAITVLAIRKDGAGELAFARIGSKGTRAGLTAAGH